MHQFKTIPFSSSRQDFEKLFLLEKTLDYDVPDYGSVDMLKYQASLIPKICNPHTEFLELDGTVLGYGYTGHQPWAFDGTLLDSNISIPHSKEFSRPAENYLASQILNARNTQNVDTLRAWVFKNDEFMENLYFGAGFEKSLVEFTSIVLLDNFEAEKYIKYVNNFKDQSMEIHRLTALKEDYVDWEDKLHELWFRVELDVPSDIEVKEDKAWWKANILNPWHHSDDFYIVLDGDNWIALSAYDRSDQHIDTVSTSLTGVLPEYRRRSICTALKVHSLNDLKRQGFKSVFTSNEENNPMYLINLMLGFKKIGMEAGYKLSLNN